MRSVDRLVAARQLVRFIEAIEVPFQAAFKNRMSVEFCEYDPGVFGIVSAPPDPSRLSLPKAVFDRPSVTAAMRVMTLPMKDPSAIVTSPPLAPSPAQKS